MKKRADLQELMSMYQMFSPEQKAKEELLWEQARTAAQQRAFAEELHPSTLERARVALEQVQLQNQYIRDAQPLQLSALAQQLAQGAQQNEYERSSMPARLAEQRARGELERLKAAFEQSTFNDRLAAVRSQLAQQEAVTRDARAKAQIAAKDVDYYEQDRNALDALRKSQAGSQVAQIVMALTGGMPTADSKPADFYNAFAEQTGLPVFESAQAIPAILQAVRLKRAGTQVPIHQNDLEQLMQSAVPLNLLTPEELAQVQAYQARNAR